MGDPRNAVAWEADRRRARRTPLTLTRFLAGGTETYTAFLMALQDHTVLNI